MNRLATILITCLAVLALGMGAYWLGQRMSPQREASFVVYPEYEEVGGRYIYPPGMRVVEESELPPACLDLWNWKYEGDECLKSLFHDSYRTYGKIFIAEGNGEEIFEYYKYFPGRKGKIDGMLADTDGLKLRRLGFVPYPYSEQSPTYVMVWSDTHTVVVGLGGSSYQGRIRL